MNGTIIFGRIGIEQYIQTFLPQTFSQKTGPWPAAREPLTSLCSILIEP
jgi:hypothetical protein